MIVFDAGVLIAHLEKSDVFHDAAVGFLEEHEEFEFVVSPITLSECLVRPAAAGQAHLVFGALRALRFEQLTTTADDVVGIAEIRAAAGLKMSDALVVHTAESRGGELVTTDRAVARAAEARGITAHLLAA